MKLMVPHIVNTILTASCLLVLVCSPARLSAQTSNNLSVVPLLNGERGEPTAANLKNSWGGGFGSFNTASIEWTNQVVRSGNGAYQIDVGTPAANELSFVQLFSCQTSGVQDRRQTRDLTRYDRFELHINNQTNATLNITFELKDYRDSLQHRAIKTFTIPNNVQWTPIGSSLDLSDGWTVIGSPDLTRCYAISLVFAEPVAVSGNYFIDDFNLIEPGVLDIENAALRDLVQRLAQRHFLGLWHGRNHVAGLSHNTHDSVDLGAMNTTAGLLWMLPCAVQRGWISQVDADTFTEQLVISLNNCLDNTTWLPTRFVDPLTAMPLGSNSEESSVDAAFMALALHRYKTWPATAPALANQIDALENRFQFDAFEISTGFRLAYFPATGFTSGTYDGYTGEGKVISLAAALSVEHHVPILQTWHDDTFRSFNHLASPSNQHLTHSEPAFRAPFEQALLNLFVDVKDRGADNYPVAQLAVNPWRNFVRYHRDVAARLSDLGRENFFQPDAGSGAPFSAYQQYSLYDDFGQADLFMPWSIAFAVLAGVDQAEPALRMLLQTDGIVGPQGLADSVRWNTGEDSPSFVSNLGDNWNIVLSTMAWMQWLDNIDSLPSASQSFANTPSVAASLDLVFFPAGDINRDGLVNLLDVMPLVHLISSNEYQAEADVDANGITNLLDVTLFVQLLFQ